MFQRFLLGCHTTPNPFTLSDITPAESLKCRNRQTIQNAMIPSNLEAVEQRETSGSYISGRFNCVHQKLQGATVIEKGNHQTTDRPCAARSICGERRLDATQKSTTPTSWCIGTTVQYSPAATRPDARHLQHPSAEFSTCLYGHNRATLSLVGSSQTNPEETAVGFKDSVLSVISQGGMCYVAIYGVK